MDDELKAALERLFAARDAYAAAEEKLNTAIVEFVNTAAAKAKLGEFAGPR